MPPRPGRGRPGPPPRPGFGGPPPPRRPPRTPGSCCACCCSGSCCSCSGSDSTTSEEKSCWTCDWFSSPPEPVAEDPLLPAKVGDIYLTSLEPPASVNPLHYRELRCEEYLVSDRAEHYYFTIANDITLGQIVKVDCAGRVFTVRIPDYVDLGETVIVVVPVPSSAA